MTYIISFEFEQLLNGRRNVVSDEGGVSVMACSVRSRRILVIVNAEPPSPFPIRKKV